MKTAIKRIVFIVSAVALLVCSTSYERHMVETLYASGTVINDGGTSAPVWSTAQEVKKPDADKEPVLTELQIEKLDNRIRTAQLAGQQADAKAIAAAIVEMIEARQKAAVAAANEANAYFQSLTVEGWTLDVQTKKYTKKKE